MPFCLGDDFSYWPISETSILSRLNDDPHQVGEAGAAPAADYTFLAVELKHPGQSERGRRVNGKKYIINSKRKSRL